MFRLNRPFRHLTKLVLDPTAKQNIRGRLVQLMNVERIQNQPRHLWYNPLKMIPMPIFALILATMIGGGTAYAAEGAVPGETLYPVKIHVNEEIREALLLRAEKKAEWQLERAHRRAEEALVKQQRGDLDEALRARIEAQIRKHEARSEEVAQKLEAKGNVNAALKVRERMEKYLARKTEVLENLETKKEAQEVKEVGEVEEEKSPMEKRKELRKERARRQKAIENL